MRASGTIALGLITICAVAFQLRVGHDEEGVTVSREQAVRVFGGDSSTHYYTLAGSTGYCSNSSYKACGSTNQCVITTTAAQLADQGTKCYVPNQPCSMMVCQGGTVANCGSMAITGCT